MNQPPASVARSRLALAGWTLVFAVLAALVDWYAPVIFIGHSFVLGMVLYWVALHRLGPGPAALVLTTSAVALTIKWSQPYSSALVALEGLMVGWAWRQRRNPLLADALYWLVLGTPASWFLYRHVYIIPHPAFEHALVVQVVNGFIAVWIAVVIIEFLPRPPDGSALSPAETFRTFMVKRYIAFGTFPVLLVALLAARQFEKNSLELSRQHLDSTARRMAADIGRHVARAAQTVAGLAARESTTAEFSKTDHIMEQLAQAQHRDSQFVTMLAADARGTIVASAVRPGFALAPVSALGTSVADRNYFRVPLQTGSIYVSDVFQGRGFGRDILVAISAPIVTHEGDRLGIIEGSIEVGSLAAFVRENTPPKEWRAVLTDQKQQVVAALGFDYTPLTRLDDTPLGRLIAQGRRPPARFTDDVGKSRVSFLSVTEPVPDTNWSVTVQRTWADVLHPVTSVYLTTLAVLVAAVAAAFLINAWSVREFLRAGRALVTFSRDPLAQVRELESVATRDLPREFQELLRNLSAMAGRLASEQRQREQLVAELESRVQARTQQLEQALVAAQAADRAKSAFLATVSHELRTPLTSIITGTTLLKRGAGAKSDLETRTLATLEKSSQVLMNVISDVLDYSKLEAGSVTLVPRPFHPAALMADVVLILTPNARQAGLTLTHEARHAADLEWSGDEARIRQVLVNLAGNAVKFTATGGVRLSSWVTEATPTQPRRLCFAVQDSGPGIPADQQAAIFDPFVQLENKRVLSQAGTGLGLSICRKLVMVMGGQISLTSRLGEGSTFEFWLPEHPPATPSVPPEKEA